MQSKTISLVEAILNTLSGLFVAYFVWIFIVSPIWGIEMSTIDIFGINAVFTVVSVARSYLWRRLFNKGEKNACKNAD